jgi:hypothetical protein
MVATVAEKILVGASVKEEVKPGEYVTAHHPLSFGLG